MGNRLYQLDYNVDVQSLVLVLDIPQFSKVTFVRTYSLTLFSELISHKCSIDSLVIVRVLSWAP